MFCNFREYGAGFQRLRLMHFVQEVRKIAFLSAAQWRAGVT